jgi:hypothetical protein
MNDAIIKLELSIEEVNMILRVLGKHPFEEVVAVINKVKSQGDPQVIAMAPVADAPVADAPAQPAA